ncbi:class D sortase [Salibacterium aidingense]|uniref:class D sortase n=1 Tax=Salibacterium aidingense TaxID=384933 RepID=UPI003BC5B989
MKTIGNILVAAGLLLIGIFGYQYWSYQQAQHKAMTEAKERINAGTAETVSAEEKGMEQIRGFSAEKEEAFATLEIPKLDRTIPIVEGADEEALKNGVGHVSITALPGQDNQIVLSGHRDTVFRDFGELEIGDRYIVEMPYGKYEYEIKEDKIVPEDDTSVIGERSEEVLVVSTCYPFDYVGFAPERYVTYAYPVE